ncbi:MAG: Gfo/Idh/MocA family oxidoreductase [Pirellulales bacterium]
MSHRSRREFLEQSMWATATAVAAGSTLVHAEEKQSSSPNEKLGVAVVGVKGRGGSHIGAFAGRKDTEILYVCDVDEEIGNSRVNEIGKRQGGRAPQWEADLRKVLEDKRVDIVSIATPNHWHALGAIWSIQAGKDVYVEKPVSHNVSEGRRIVEAARKYNKICQTGTQSRSNPGLKEAAEFAKSGKIGEVKVARGLCYKRRGSIGPSGDYAPPKSVNFDLWSGPAPLAKTTRKQFHYDWHWQWLYGNGDLGNQGIHQMDIARWGLGVDTLCQGVLSYGARLGYVDAGETANTQVVILDYGPKSLVFEVRGLETPPYRGAGVGVVFEGTEGYVVIPSYSAGAAFDKAGNKIAEFKGEADHFANFLTAVRSRKSSDLNADILEGHLSSALCHLGNISYRLGEEVAASEVAAKISEYKSADDDKATLERTLEHLAANKVDVKSSKIRVGAALTFDPKTERFPVNNEAANAMLSREYRAPFEVPAEGKV